MDDNELTEESLIAVDSRSETPSENGEKRSQVPGPLVFSLLACCIVGIALCVKWVLTDELGGFNSENGNWHFLLMTLFIIFTAIGTLSFRLFTRISRPMAKLIHAISLSGAFIISVVGLISIFNFHNDKGIPNLYTLHSWIGLLFVIVFGIQWLVGVLSFLLSLVPPTSRAFILPYHRAFGTILTIGIVMAAVIGINEKMIFPNNLGFYKEKGSLGMIANFFGLFLLFIGSISVYIQIKPDFKRTENKRQY